MSRAKIPLIEFYITNVCNLECRGCNRFNNYKFTGHYYWDDHAEEIEAWSRRIDPETICIMGGEPTLNPDLEKWVANLRRLWPDNVIMIQSNGTYVRPEFKTFWKKYRVSKPVALHDRDAVDEIIAKNPESTWFIDAFVFQQAAVIEQPGHFNVHTSDTTKAFEFCCMKNSHTMHSGKLYKCPVTAVLPEFTKQFNVNLDDRQRALMEAYTPLSHDCTDEELHQFIDSLDNPIPQCEFCPTIPNWHTAYNEYQEDLPRPSFGKYIHITPEQGRKDNE